MSDHDLIAEAEALRVELDQAVIEEIDNYTMLSADALDEVTTAVVARILPVVADRLSRVTADNEALKAHDEFSMAMVDKLIDGGKAAIAERDALQAQLDQVRALRDDWKRGADDGRYAPLVGGLADATAAIVGPGVALPDTQNAAKEQ